MDEACSQHVVTDDNSVDAASAAAAVFAAAPFVEERELRQLLCHSWVTFYMFMGT